jgi:integration host factor subunit alpha
VGCGGFALVSAPAAPAAQKDATFLTCTAKLANVLIYMGEDMTSNTLTRMDLSEAVFREVGLSRNESAQLVETVLEEMSDALVRGEQVKISSFGTFSIRDKTARIGRNPKTGEEVPINPRRVLTFRPSHLMKDRVADGNKS